MIKLGGGEGGNIFSLASPTRELKTELGPTRLTAIGILCPFQGAKVEQMAMHNSSSSNNKTNSLHLKPRTIPTVPVTDRFGGDEKSGSTALSALFSHSSAELLHQKKGTQERQTQTYQAIFPHCAKVH